MNQAECGTRSEKEKNIVGAYLCGQVIGDLNTENRHEKPDAVDESQSRSLQSPGSLEIAHHGVAGKPQGSACKLRENNDR
jgi:hypothetical protein